VQEASPYNYLYIIPVLITRIRQDETGSLVIIGRVCNVAHSFRSSAESFANEFDNRTQPARVTSQKLEVALVETSGSIGQVCVEGGALHEVHLIGANGVKGVASAKTFICVHEEEVASAETFISIDEEEVARVETFIAIHEEEMALVETVCRFWPVYVFQSVDDVGYVDMFTYSILVRQLAWQQCCSQRRPR
jgi:hypothetical protein